MCGTDYFWSSGWEEFYDKLVFREINGKPVLKDRKY